MLVHELMTPDVVTFHPETLITDAARTLLHNGITAAPVVDHEGGLVGIVGQRDLLAGRVTADPRAHLAVVRPSRGERPRLVRDVMSADVVTVSPTDDDAEATRVMVGRGFASLPVVVRHRLVGMLSVTDILRGHTDPDAEIAQALHQRFFATTEGVSGLHHRRRL
jgi:CBS domain-containing protein